MVKILSSLDGRRAGIASDGRLISVNGFVAGDDGNQIDFQSPIRIAHYDDFEGNALSTRWQSRLGSDGSAAAAILSGGIGGILRLTSGAAGTGLAADEASIVQTLQWKAAQGGLHLQTRLKLSAITTMWAFVGFTDVASSLQKPIESSTVGDGITTNASNAVGFLFDTRMTTKNWWCTGVAADVDAVSINAATLGAVNGAPYTPVAAQFVTMRIGINASGVANFYLNGLLVGSAMAGAVTPATMLTPIIAVGKTSVAASMTMDVDYSHVSMTRAADGGAA